MKVKSIQREITRLRLHLNQFWLSYNGRIPLDKAILSTKIIKARITELEQKLK